MVFVVISYAIYNRKQAFNPTYFSTLEDQVCADNAIRYGAFFLR